MAPAETEQAGARGGADPARAVTLIANNVGGIGGMEYQLERLILGLLDRGFAITVIAWSCELPERPGLRWVRLRGPRRPFAIALPWFLAASTIAARRHARGLLHATGAIVALPTDVTTVHFCHRAFRRTRVSRATRRGPLYATQARLASALSALAERWRYRPSRVHELVAVSEGLATELRTEFPDVADRVRVIPNGVDTLRYARDPAAGLSVRGTLGIPGDAPVAAFVGSDWGRKGLRFAVEALEAAPGWHLLVVGDGDIPRFRVLASSLGVADRLHFPGPQTDVVPYLSAATAFVCPTAYETFSMASYEAAAIGLPLLATPVSGIEDILVEGRTGWAVKRSGADIARRLNKLGDEPALVAKLGEAARRAVAPYDWERIVDAYAGLYESVDSEGRGEQTSHPSGSTRNSVTARSRRSSGRPASSE